MSDSGEVSYEYARAAYIAAADVSGSNVALGEFMRFSTQLYIKLVGPARAASEFRRIAEKLDRI